VCHGKCGPLRAMAENDWIVYYSPVEIFGEKKPCRKFTAIGQVNKNSPYQVDTSTSPGFKPFRRDISFLPDAMEADIAPLVDKLSFIANKSKWGFPFRQGCFAVPAGDFEAIARSMGVRVSAKEHAAPTATSRAIGDRADSAASALPSEISSVKRKRLGGTS
jgi:hypothetical protein